MSTSGGTSTSTPPAASPALAAVPTTLTATGSGFLVTLTWAASSGATSYNVQRSSQHGGPYEHVGSTTSPAFFDGAVTNGTTYYYVVSAVNSGGASANSAEVFATPTAPTAQAAPLAAVPAGLSATGSSFLVTLTWTASTGATSYTVLRATQRGGPYTSVGSTTSPAFFDGAVTNGTAYYYVVSAVNSGGASANSADRSPATHCYRLSHWPQCR